MLQLIIDNYLLIVLVFGFLFLLSNHLKIDSRRNNKFIILIILVIAVAISNFFEVYFSNFDYYNYGRVIFSFLCYSLRPFILLTFISILTNHRSIKYFYSLSIINALIYAASFFTDIVFGFDNSDHFYRGALGYFAHIVYLVYLVLFIVIIIKKFNKRKYRHTILLLFIMLACLFAAFFDSYKSYSNVFDSTILVCILLYYLFLYMEYNKKDILTGINNRSSFFFDSNDFENMITAVISIDMNNLKYINDNYGHDEGDNALITVAKIFKKFENVNIHFYRLGGDEFEALCFNVNLKEVKSLVKLLKEELSHTKYSCSIGYEMRNEKEDVYELYKEADKRMYVEKEKFHKKNNKVILK